MSEKNDHSFDIHVEADLNDLGEANGKYTGYVDNYPAAPSMDSHGEALREAKAWADWMSK
jgi:hypothetical protein